MTFDVRTKNVIKEADGKYVATYEAFDTDDSDTVIKEFPIDGMTPAEITTKLRAKVTKEKADYDQKNNWIAMSDAVIADLKDDGVL